VLQSGDANPRGPWLTPVGAALAVAGAITIAAVLAIAGVVTQFANYSGSSFGDRVEFAGIFSITAMGVVLAAAVAMSCTESTASSVTTVAHWRSAAYGALLVIAGVDGGASGWGLLDAFIRSQGEGPSRIWADRLALATASLAPGLLAIAAIIVIVRARRSVRPTVAAESRSLEVYPKGLIGPTVRLLLAAGLVSIALAVDAGFTGAASVDDRVAVVSLTGAGIAPAFIAFAVVVLVTLGCLSRDRPRESEPLVAIAGLIALFVTVAATYSVWISLTVSSSSTVPLFAVGASWWMRSTYIATALAAGTISVVGASLARRLRAGDRSRFAADRAREASPFAPPASQPEVAVGASTFSVANLRNDAPAVAGFLAASSAAYAAFAVLTVAGSTGVPISVNDLIVTVSPYVLTVAGLALAAALVMAVSRPDALGGAALNDAVDVSVALVAVAVVAVSGYSMCVALFGNHGGPFSIFAHVGIARRLTFVGTSLAAVLIGAAAIHVVVRGRQIVADRDTERELAALERLP
jgi:hypothetical protein